MSSEHDLGLEDDVVISLNKLSKTYRLFNTPSDRLKQFLSLGLRRYHREFTAVHNINLAVRRGDTIGIIGRNGSGKSTLLQLICGILKPTSGTITTRGRISALLELGAGFNQDFTGRENVYFQGAILGLDKTAMDARFDAIANFSDIGEFIDQPVRTYSSGMFIRLAFSLAVHVDPDILVVDEALAVGDAAFQQKCFDRIHRLQSQGTTIIVVTHNPYQVENLCNKAAVMNRGILSQLRPARETLSLYHEMVQQDITPGDAEPFREGTQQLLFAYVRTENQSGEAIEAVQTLDTLYITAEFSMKQPMDGIRIRFEICSSDNEVVAMVTANGLTEQRTFDGRHRVVFAMSPCQLTSGWYYINAIAVDRHVRLDTWQRAAEFKVLLGNEAARNLTSDRGIFVCQGRWLLD